MSDLEIKPIPYRSFKAELIDRKRKRRVRKSNISIQEAKYDLNPHELKLLAYIFTIMYNETGVYKQKTFSLSEFKQILGSKNTSYDHAKRALQKIKSCSFWLLNGQDNEICINFFSSIEMKKGTSEVTVNLQEELIPHLEKNDTLYTTYPLMYILPMKSKYSIRLYELLRSYLNLRQWRFSIEKIHMQLCLPASYEKFQNFRRAFIEPAVKEINGFSDILVEYEFIKTGRNYTHIEFKFKSKNEKLKVITENDIRIELDGQTKLYYEKV